MAPFFEGLGCHRRQEGMREHGQSDVPVPADVAAEFVLVQAALILRGVEALLEGPPGSRNANQFGNGGLYRGGLRQKFRTLLGILGFPGAAA